LIFIIPTRIFDYLNQMIRELVFNPLLKKLTTNPYLSQANINMQKPQQKLRFIKRPILNFKQPFNLKIESADGFVNNLVESMHGFLPQQETTKSTRYKLKNIYQESMILPCFRHIMVIYEGNSNNIIFDFWLDAKF
jgi:hypothetical protein